MKKYFFILLVLLFQTIIIFPQTVYSIDASKTDVEIKSGYFKMGNPGTEGKQILINNRYLAINNKPIVPVMGELQFSRTPRNEWEDRILKMKACGINVISTYIIWIHHEEAESQFDWNGNKDLRSFIQLCSKHEMLVCLRIGPYVHGEVRNGGFPDWLMLKENIKSRTNDSVYQYYVDHWYAQIGLQAKGLMYKDGGPVICIQLENEYTHGKQGEAHIMWLKNTAIKYGFDVPVYSVTGWGDGSVPPDEVIPLWGGYPDEPWDFNIDKIRNCGNFEFSAFRDDNKIGNNLAQRKDRYMDYSADPYFTCEMGIGVQNTYHRRLAIGNIDGYAMACAKTGSGSNLLGYYIFSGGTNPHGIYTNLNEEKEQAGNWTETPIMSYDFQAAIKEDGELAPSYYEVKKLNYFLNEFGNVLAPMEAAFPAKNNDLQYAVRAKDDHAFLFGINYCRNNKVSEKKNVQFSLKLKNETVLFPSKPINISDSCVFIFPVNLDLNGVNLKYATAQPLCKIDDSTWIFFDPLNQSPEFSFSGNNIHRVETTIGNINKSNDYIVSELKPRLNCMISIETNDGKKIRIIILSKEESKHAWLLKNNDQTQFFICNNNLCLNGNNLKIFGLQNEMKLSVLKNDSSFSNNIHFTKKSADGVFTTYSYSVKSQIFNASYKQVFVLNNAQWLKTSVKKIEGWNLLYHKLFLKEFDLKNPSNIKSASLTIRAESYCRAQMNYNWIINQTVDSNKLSVIDITGFLKNGDNNLLIDFPFETGNKSFAARVVVDYFNSDKIEFATDSSWLTSGQYNFPSQLVKYPSTFVAPEIVKKEKSKDVLSLYNEYKIEMPHDFSPDINNVYASLKYNGDKAFVYDQTQLAEDNFNANVSLDLSLKRFESIPNNEFSMKIFPLLFPDKILFDVVPAKDAVGKSNIQSLRFIPEYKIEIPLQ